MLMVRVPVRGSRLYVREREFVIAISYVCLITAI